MLETEIKSLDERVTKLEALPSEVTDVGQGIVDISIEVTKLKTTIFDGDTTAVYTVSSGGDNRSQIAEEVKLD